MHVPVTVVGLMLSCVLGGPEKPKPAGKETPIPREDYRYDGKSFEQWRRILRTELKPERRVEALKALRAFIPKGYGAEAAAAAVELMADYSIEEYPLNLLYDTIQVIDDAGTAAQPALLHALKGENVNRCRFALRNLSSGTTSLAFALPSLAELARSRNGQLHTEALEVLAGHYPQEGVREVLSAAMKHQDVTIRQAAVLVIAKNVSVIDEKILRLALFSLRDKEETLRVAGAKAMGGFLKDYPRDGSGDNEAKDRAALVWEAALYGFKGLPGLLAAVEDRSSEVRRQAIESLGPFVSFSADITRAINKALGDSDPSVSKAAAKVVTKDGGR